MDRLPHARREEHSLAELCVALAGFALDSLIEVGASTVRDRRGPRQRRGDGLVVGCSNRAVGHRLLRAIKASWSRSDRAMAEASGSNLTPGITQFEHADEALGAAQGAAG